MADDTRRTLVQLPELNEAPGTGDLFYVVDISDTSESLFGTSKKITKENLLGDLALDADLVDHTSDTNNPHSVGMSQLSDFDADNNVIENVATPVADGDAANKEYVDDLVDPFTPSFVNYTSNSTPTPTGNFRENELYITALTTAAELQEPTGTPVNGNKLLARIKDDGTARALTYHSIYQGIADTLPSSTVAGKVLYLGFRYNSNVTKWQLVAIVQE